MMKQIAAILLSIAGIFHSHSSPLYGHHEALEEYIERFGKEQKLFYYLYVSDFLQSAIDIPINPIPAGSSTTGASYFAGRAPIYDVNNQKIGICSASFLNMENAEGIFTDISNYLSVDNGLIVSWFTPTRPANLELDSILHSMVTQCIVVASTKIGFNPFYGMTFNLTVSSDDEKIYFRFTKR